MKNNRVLRIIFLVTLIGFALFRVPMASATSEHLINGMFEIRDITDVKEWTFTLPAGYEYLLEFGYYSPGSAHLRCRVSSPELEFDIFDQVFVQGDGPSDNHWKFATPTGGRYTIALYLQEPGDYAIAVYVHLWPGSPLDNVWADSRWPENIALIAAGVYASDAVTTRLFDVNLHANTTYFFSVTAATRFDYRYGEWFLVTFDAELVSQTTGACYLVANNLTIFNPTLSPTLAWQSTWFGCPKNDTYTLRTFVTCPSSFRVGLGLTIAADQSHGSTEKPPESDDGDTNSTNTAMSQATTVLMMIVGGLIVIPMIASSARNRRRRRVGTGVRLPLR